MLAFCLPFFLVLLFSTSTTQPYIPTDQVFLNCGSSAATYSNYERRHWDGEKHSKFVPSNITTTSFSSTSDNLDPSVPQIPYFTARIFNTCSFTYTFHVSSQGPKFVRLHFYPTTYSGLNTEQSFFDVSSNGYSLLTNFSAFIAVSYLRNTRNDGDAIVIKEFLIYVKDTQILNLTFTPSPNSYAFINGIEIVSMPENLYFNAKIPKVVNQYTGPIINNNTTLENIYRLNMGGGQLSSQDDTGMYRAWDQDNNYIYGAAIGLTPLYNNPIMYTTETPNYVAPEAVYQTQRSMGKLSDKYNLTWLLPVDSGFYYMLRLHFCNIIPQYTKKGQVVFKIFINNRTADEEVDLFYMTQGSGYPVFLDYVVFVNNTGGHRGKLDLWLAMHPNPNSELYLDAYLNGLEVFKLSMNGKVYKGYMDNATTIVAIKRLNPSSSQGFHEFFTEISLLSKLQHVHLVSIIGYCVEDGEMVLIYDYMAHGTLREHLYKTNNPPLPWKRRLDICIGAAKGLNYLHSMEKRAIIHRDVKSTNILLDENWVAKVSDFGLSKLGSKDPSKTHVSTGVKGSFGYIDPEYCRTKQLTEKSDVYSFGVVLFEVLCARPAIVQQVRDEQVNLAEWGKSCHRKGTLEEIIDPNLSGEIAPRCLRKFGEVASSCLHEIGSERPEMEEVVWGLEFALELQEAA
ncbi:putative protein kinase RLK-Pelle-CrRLK1L-1 family [Helianthus debilis subsp. tardiflorus]